MTRQMEMDTQGQALLDGQKGWKHQTDGQSLKDIDSRQNDTWTGPKSQEETKAELRWGFVKLLWASLSPPTVSGATAGRGGGQMGCKSYWLTPSISPLLKSRQSSQLF